MIDILRGLREVQGVHGAIVADGNGRIVAYDAEAIYDANLLAQLSRAVASAVDSIKLMHEDWDVLTSNFSDGKLIVRNVPAQAGAPSATLTVVADPSLSPSFGSVAIRVAVTKLRAALAAGAGSGSHNSMPTPVASLSSPHNATPLPGSSASPLSSSVLSVPQAEAPFAASSTPAGSSLSWSGLGSTGASGLSGSGVAVADPASSAALTACTKALARAVGPMAKVFVKEAVRRVCPDRPFSKDQTRVLVAELEKSIEDPSDIIQFRRAIAKTL